MRVLAEAGSTNAEAMQAAGPWELVAAEAQRAGRGRLDRTWEAPPGLALTFSATLPLPTGAPGWAPLVAGLAVADAITAETGLAAGLKWPNDVLLPADAERKVCGILCEYRPPTPQRPGVVVVGIGLNVAQSREQLPVPTATSLELAGSGPVDRERLLVAVLDALAERYAALQAGGSAAAAVRTAYTQACTTIGAAVRLTRPAGPEVNARAVGIDADGALLVDDGSGPQAYAAGDVTHVRARQCGPGLA